MCLSVLSYGYLVYRGPHHNPDSRLALTYSLVERHALDIDPYANTTLDRAFISGHYYTDKAPYKSALEKNLESFKHDGIISLAAAQGVYRDLKTFDPGVQTATIDLAKTISESTSNRSST